MLHVIEHLDSPHETVKRVAEVLRPGGAVLIETPTIDNLWFRLAPKRWRQLIPDHYFFFSRATLERLLRNAGWSRSIIRPSAGASAPASPPTGYAAPGFRDPRRFSER